MHGLDRWIFDAAKPALFPRGAIHPQHHPRPCKYSRPNGSHHIFAAFLQAQSCLVVGSRQHAVWLQRIFQLLFRLLVPSSCSVFLFRLLASRSAFLRHLLTSDLMLPCPAGESGRVRYCLDGAAPSRRDARAPSIKLRCTKLHRGGSEAPAGRRRGCWLRPSVPRDGSLPQSSLRRAASSPGSRSSRSAPSGRSITSKTAPPGARDVANELGRGR